MSLLLDALKRAEEAKRAKQLLEDQSAKSTPDVAPLSERVERTPPPPVEADLQLADYADFAPPRVTDAPEVRGEKNENTRRPALTLEDPVHLPAALSPTSVRNTVNTPQVSAASATEDQQRQTAQNVFATKQASKEINTKSRKSWMVPVLAVSLVMVGVGVWYVWNQVKALTGPVTQAVAARTAPPSAASSSLPAAAAKTGQLGATGADETQKTVEATLPPLLPPPIKDAPLPKLAVSKVADSGVVLTDREVLAKSLKDAPAAQEPAVALKLTRATELPAVNPDISRAYEALKNGNYIQAKQLYAQITSADPYNLDAQLGYAAASARLGEFVQAAGHYRDALAVDPRNATAIAGLLAIGRNSSGTNEVELRTLIARSPDAAPLHFSLGNLYSGEKRWVEAQQAYFEAFRLDSDAADYAYNLAVSLDQLNQPRLAQEYYQKALALQVRFGGQFDKDTVMTRIKELRSNFASR